MGIDLIEQCELPAFKESPNFVEQYNTNNGDLMERTDGYANALGISFGGNLIHKLAVENAQDKSRAALDAKWEVNAKFPMSNDCESLSLTMDKLNAEVYKVNQSMMAGGSAKSLGKWLNAYNERQLQIKKKMMDLNCTITQEQEQLAKDQEATLKALAEATGDPVPMTDAEKMNKYIIWGISGLISVLAIIILFKKKKPAQ